MSQLCWMPSSVKPENNCSYNQQLDFFQIPGSQNCETPQKKKVLLTGLQITNFESNQELSPSVKWQSIRQIRK